METELQVSNKIREEDVDDFVFLGSIPQPHRDVIIKQEYFDVQDTFTCIEPDVQCNCESPLSVGNALSMCQHDHDHENPTPCPELNEDEKNLPQQGQCTEYVHQDFKVKVMASPTTSREDYHGRKNTEAQRTRTPSPTPTITPIIIPTTNEPNGLAVQNSAKGGDGDGDGKVAKTRSPTRRRTFPITPQTPKPDTSMMETMKEYMQELYGDRFFVGVVLGATITVAMVAAMVWWLYQWAPVFLLLGIFASQAVSKKAVLNFVCRACCRVCGINRNPHEHPKQ